MNRNTEQHFAYAPTVGIERSVFPMSQNIKTTFNMGDLIPFYVDMDILPGDTIQLNWTGVIRQNTPIYPTMDNSYLDVYFFAIPWRLVWQHTKEFFGENKTGAWTQQTEYVIPKMTTPTGGASKGTLMDYMGIPLGVAGLDFASLPLRAYVMTYNEHFRDQNLIAPVTEYTDDTDRTADNTTSALGGAPLKAAKFHDYFTSCLPEAQKGNPVTLPIGQSAPIYGNDRALKLTEDNQKWFWLSGAQVPVTPGQTSYVQIYQASRATSGQTNTGDTANQLMLNQDAWNEKLLGIPKKELLEAGGTTSGIYADLSQAVAATINAQRIAFATQRILEQNARGGTRYAEIIRGFYGVTSPDARQQRPEYLGGKQIPITMQAVAQTSSTDTTSPQGNLSAFSHTTDSDRMFTKSFTEHTIILGLCVARQDHSYNQGLNRMWSRRRLLDVYNPKMARLGEQAVLNKEIFAQGSAVVNPTTQKPYDEETFGFQERWAEYRYKPNLITGAFRTTYAQSLDSWHYGDNYGSLPGLSQNWIQETKDYLDRTLAVTSAVEDQYLCDFLVEIKATRPMPVYSVPGLIDHY